MNKLKKILAAILCLLILLAVVFGVVWHMQHYVIVGMKLYPKDAESLDLRGQKLTVSQYQTLSRSLPDCKIAWDVPFQGSTYAQNTEVLQLTTLTGTDVKTLALFEELTTVDARGCTEYALLQQVKQYYPDLDVQYTVTIGAESYAQDARTVNANEITEEETALLQYLPNLEEVCVQSATDSRQMTALSEFCEKQGVALKIMLGGKGYSQTAKTLQLEKATDEELNLLYLLPELTKLHLVNPMADPQRLIRLEEEYPGLKVTWEKEILGVLYDSTVTQIDLTEAISPKGAYAYEQAAKAPVQGDRDEVTYLFATDSDYPLPDMTTSTAKLIADVEAALAYFPSVEMVLMCGSILDNDAMAEFREKHRTDYKVVWTVQCGGMVARTDTPYFMPTKYHVYYFQDHESGNLIYCEDMICIDLGHMSIKNIEFVAKMPKLEYLILAHTDVRSIDPIVNCPKLKFLELDWSAVKDFEPLVNCTVLEDLNLGNTYGNFEVLHEMTWLKNVWMVGCSRRAATKMVEALPDSNVMVSGSATVANGWRDLPNYYEMRDIMGMYYMSW